MPREELKSLVLNVEQRLAREYGALVAAARGIEEALRDVRDLRLVQDEAAPRGPRRRKGYLWQGLAPVLDPPLRRHVVSLWRKAYAKRVRQVRGVTSRFMGLHLIRLRWVTRTTRRRTLKRILKDLREVRGWHSPGR